MNYSKIYNSLVNSRKYFIRNIDEYVEKHHIIPKCMGGSNSYDNLVKLSYREHFLAHLLLTKIYPNDSKMHYALVCMLRKQPKGERILTSKQYETIKKIYKKFCIENNILFYIHQTEQMKKNTSIRMSGNNNPMIKFPDKNPFSKKSYVLGRKWYNNGEINLYIFENEPIPDGFIKGMKPNIKPKLRKKYKK